jgi:hypothetical protein
MNRMKQYIDDRGLRLVGKAWEIRMQLRKLSGSNGQGQSPRKLNEWVKAGGQAAR